MHPPLPIATGDLTHHAVGADHPEPGASSHVLDVRIERVGIALQLIYGRGEAVWSYEKPCAKLGHALGHVDVEVVRADGQANVSELRFNRLDVRLIPCVIEVPREIGQRAELPMLQDDLPSAVDDDGGVVGLAVVRFLQAACANPDSELLRQLTQDARVLSRYRERVAPRVLIEPTVVGGFRNAYQIGLQRRGLMDSLFRTGYVACEIAVLYAHLDHVKPSAGDNASGCAILYSLFLWCMPATTPIDRRLSLKIASDCGNIRNTETSLPPADSYEYGSFYRRDT